jgi:hypothetical protein
MRMASRTALMLPHPRIARPYATRGLALWLGARAIAGALMLLGSFDLRSALTAQAPMLVLLSVLIGVIHAMRHHEGILLANLALGRRTILLMLAIPAVLGESALHLLDALIP